MIQVLAQKMIQFSKASTLLFGMGVMLVFLLQLTSAGRISRREVGGCHCSDFTWFRSERDRDFRDRNDREDRNVRRRGTFLGGCRSRNEDGDKFCYVHQPNDCDDARPSRKFRGMDVSAEACQSCGCRCRGKRNCDQNDDFDFNRRGTSLGEVHGIDTIDEMTLKGNDSYTRSYP